MPNVLVVHDSETTRSELSRALSAEGFQTTEADSRAAAVREIWAGNFAAAVVADKRLEDELKNLAPEIVTMLIGREPASKLARKLADLLDGAAAA